MIYAKKSLGQNFLINSRVLDKIAGAAELNKNDVVLEIGSGTGLLTEKLAEKAGKVIAIEKDHRLIESLQEKFKGKNIEIIEGDILKLDVDELFRNSKLEIRNSDYKVVGNIPYYITSHLLKIIFEKWPRPKLVVLTVQKEVAQRIVAKPPHMNLLALSVQFYAELKIISYISRGSFRPMPKVDSAIIRLVPHKEAYDKRQETTEKFFNLIRAGFSGKRKQLTNTLQKFIGSKEKIKEVLAKLGLKPNSRPEELGLEDWTGILKEL